MTKKKISRTSSKLNPLILPLTIVYLAIVLHNDAHAERDLSFRLGAGCMAAAVILRNYHL